MKYARRTFAIVSTISIPHPAPMSPMEAIVNPPSRGSRLDADHPQNGVLIPCRFTRRDRLDVGLDGDEPVIDVPVVDRVVALDNASLAHGEPTHHQVADVGLG